MAKAAKKGNNNKSSSSEKITSSSTSMPKEATITSSNAGSSAKRPSRESSSNSSLWMIIFLITAGCGFGFYFFFEEMKTVNKTLLTQVDDLKSEIAAMSRFQKKFEESAADLSAISSFETKMTSIENELKESIDKLSSLMRDSLAVAETNIEGLAKDMSRLRSSDQSDREKVAGLQSDIKSMQSSINEVDKSLKDNEGNLLNKLKKFETNSQNFERELSEKMAILQKTTVQQMSDVMVKIVDAKQFTESLQTAVVELRENMKNDLSSGLNKINQELEPLKEASSRLARKQEETEAKLSSLKSINDDDTDMNNVREELSSLKDKITDVSKKYASVDDVLEQASLRVETQISTLTEHVKSSKNDVSLMRDDAASVQQAVNQLRDDVNKVRITSDQLGEKFETFKEELSESSQSKSAGTKN